jgi:hypothetical protein
MRTKGKWVEIENIVLKPEERSSNIPNDTKDKPLIMWTRGFMSNLNAEVNEIVEIETLSGRTVMGKLVDLNPRYNHDFGDSIHELLVSGSFAADELEANEEVLHEE